VATTEATRQYASIAHAAQIADVHTDTIRRLIGRGDLTGYRIGTKAVRIDLAELETVFKPIGGHHAA
jgi:excisionase family DNA binding protein